MPRSIPSFAVPATLFAVLVMTLAPLWAHAQPEWVKEFQQRSSRYTANQPHWAGPVFTTVPMLVQVVREDALHQESGSQYLWNVGVSKGLQVVALPRTEFDIAVPPYIKRDNGAQDGFGDVYTAVKFRIAAAPEKRGNYIVTALLNSTVPTGTYRNGAPDATITPQLLGGKGWGRWDTVLSAAATLPVQHTETNGRVLTGNAVLQFHAARYAWPELESSTTTWFASARDGQVQSLVGPGLILGRLPYRPNEKDRRRGVSIGIGYLTAVTHYRSTNHLLQVTTRWHF